MPTRAEAVWRARDGAGVFVTLAGVIACCVRALAVSPNSVEQARSRLNAAEQNRAVALHEQAASRGRAAAAAAEAASLVAERAAAEARLHQAQRATAAAGEKMRMLDEARQDAERRVAEQSRALEPLLPVLERLSRYPAETMLAVPLPPEDAIRGVIVMHALARQIAREVGELAQRKRELRETEKALAAAAPALAQAEAAQAAAAAELARREALAEAAQRAAEKEAAAAGRRAATLEQEAASLRSLLGRLEAEAARPRSTASARIGPLGGVPTHAPGRFLSPVAGEVVTHFGGATETGPAEGVSYRSAPGAQVVAPCGGRVMFAAPFRSYGQLVILDCGGRTDAVLAGLQRLKVRVGETLGAGAALGEMPATPSELYFELRHAGKPVDPAAVHAAS